MHASRDTRVSYEWCLLIQRCFCVVFVLRKQSFDGAANPNELIFLNSQSVFSGDQWLTKEPEDSGYVIGQQSVLVPETTIFWSAVEL